MPVMVQNEVWRALNIVQRPRRVQTQARLAIAVHSPGSWHLPGCWPTSVDDSFLSVHERERGGGGDEQYLPVHAVAM